MFVKCKSIRLLLVLLALLLLSAMNKLVSVTNAQIYQTEEDILMNEMQIPMRMERDYDGVLREVPNINCPIWPDGSGHVTIPKDWKRINEAAFYMCKPLKSVSFEEGSQMTFFDRHAFASSGLETIALPPSLEWIGERCVMRACVCVLFIICVVVVATSCVARHVGVGACAGSSRLLLTPCPALPCPALPCPALAAASTPARS